MYPIPGRERVLRLATRGSPLALWQADRVSALLAEVSGAPACEVVVVRTTGDEISDVPLHQIGGQGVFVKEVQRALLEGRADIAVHSAKDLPALTPQGLILACVPDRKDPRDAVVGCGIADLPAGASVATGSVRRRAQLAWLRPDLSFVDLRGNMAARVSGAKQVGAGIVALAALQRLGFEGEVAEVLETHLMLPQVGQGALALECRQEDQEVLDLLGEIDDAAAHKAVLAERAFLRALGGGCTLPLGALGTVDMGVGVVGVGYGAGTGGTGTQAGTGTATDTGGTVTLQGMLASRDGHVLLRRHATGSDPEELGRRLALELLDDCGGRSLDDWADWTGWADCDVHL